ncbi:hypothetical protein GTX14_25410 [Streptomyces sp. SID4944]|nr:hypothetical protein [Streptomyces sp. SID4944]
MTTAVAPQGHVALGQAIHWHGENYLVAALQGGRVHLLSQHAEGEDAVVLLDVLHSSPAFTSWTRRTQRPSRPTEPVLRDGRAAVSGLCRLARRSPSGCA